MSIAELAQLLRTISLATAIASTIPILVYALSRSFREGTCPLGIKVSRGTKVKRLIYRDGESPWEENKDERHGI